MKLTHVMAINKVKKRNKDIVSFEQAKIKNAIKKALAATGNETTVATTLTNEVVENLQSSQYKNEIPTVEHIQDIVEKTLIKHNLADAAKAFILYRQKHAEQRELKQIFDVKDDLKLSITSIKVLRDRYLAKNEYGEIIETPSELFLRVAKKVAEVDEAYDDIDQEESEKQFFSVMKNLEFLPNSPTLMNAGLPSPQQLSACFVLPVEDSLECIFEAVKNMALIHKSGGGTGFSFSKIRPKGDIVKTTKGIASGPISFMRVFDKTTDVIKQGGRRRGANMGVMNITHPDIQEFITAKENESDFQNFNLSVAVTDSFIEAVQKDECIHLVNPRTNEKIKRVSAKNLFDLISLQAWRTGDPGLIFIDEVNRHNPTPCRGTIETTNPCGEVPLLAYESCNLGSINLSKMILSNHSDIDWEKLQKTIRIGIHFLDNIIDVNEYPISEIEKMTKANRKIGLGIMGFAELLIKLNIPYQSEKALDLAKKLMKFITDESRNMSQELGKRKGSFPEFKRSIFAGSFETMRNATVTTIAPTGSISVIAGCSSGIEPLFGVAFVRNIMEGTKFFEINDLFEQEIRKRKLYSIDLVKKIAKKGSVQHIDDIPKDLKDVFVTAHDLHPEVHVRMQAAFQTFTDNAVSKTVNLSADASIDDIKNIYLLAHELKCKGITVYRYGIKKNQVFSLGEEKEGVDYFNVEPTYSGGCPVSGTCEM